MYLKGSKAVLYPLFSSSFLLKVMIIRLFNPINTLDMVESRYLRTWRVSVIRVWALFLPLCWLAKAKLGGVVKIEGEFYKWTTSPECSEDRTAVLSVVKTESELCIYTCVHTPHTHIWRTAKFSNLDTDSSIDILKKSDLCILIGCKAVLYPLLFQQFPF